MFKNNEKRIKKVILSYPENKILYKKVKFLFILLFFLLISIVLIDSWCASQLEKQKNSLFGEWDEVFINVDKGKLSYFQYNAFIDKFAIQCIQDQIIYKEKKIVIGYTDSNFLDLGNIKMLEGRLPKNNREIALEEDLLPLLKVKQIGDLVPDNMNFKELEGLRLCGIVEEYSSRWNAVNWNIPFINCFINNSSKGEYYIYTAFSSNIKKDIEINMLDYKNNITFEFNSLISITYKILFLVVFLILLLLLKLFRNSYKYFFNDYIEIIDKKIQNNLKIKTIINIIGLIILYVLFSFLFSMLINNIVFDNYGINNSHLSFINQSVDNAFIISKNSSTFIENYVVSKNNFTILFFFK